MTLRRAPGSARQIVALDYEVAQEQASALGRLGRALEAALAALAEFDRMPTYQPGPQGQDRDQDHWPDQDRSLADTRLTPESRQTRAKLVAEAGHALWCFMVQRESCGLRDPRPVIRDYRVPVEVQNRMDILVAPQAGPRPRRRPAT